MNTWKLIIKLKSDLCTATGEDAPGITNIKTALEHGIPYIPAKRIKGCLLEAGREMRDNGLIKQEILNQLFGKTGSQKAEGMCVGDASLYSFPRFLYGGEKGEYIKIENYEQFQKEIQGCQEEEKAFFEDFFTRRRTRTAISAGNQTAKEHSLRTMQVVPAGIQFMSIIEGELREEEVEALQLCAKGLRHMGMGVTRGLGEIQCTLEAAAARKLRAAYSEGISGKDAELLSSCSPEEEVILSYEINLKSPVVIDGKGECLPASTLLGALAGMDIRKFSLGLDAHKDENFRRIFLQNGVQFGNGFLKNQEKVYYPCPKGIAEVKEDKGKWFCIAGQEERKRKEIHGQVFWEGKELHVLSAQKKIHFHHSRPADRGIGHALNDAAMDISVPTGEFFQYTALSKGQTYAGMWSGKAKDIRLLTECLQDHDYRLRLGRSRTAEYGNCTVRIREVSLKEKVQKTTLRGKKWLLWLLSPMVICDEETGEYVLKDEGFKEQLKKRLCCSEVQLNKIACGYTTYSGYNSRWRLPSVSCPAMAAGSSFYLETNREVSAWEIEGNRWGELTGRGCGQVAVRLLEEKEEGKIILDTVEEDGTKSNNHCVVESLLHYRNEQIECEKVTIENVDKIDEEKLPPSSAISMAAQLLRNYSHEKDFYERIKNEVAYIHKEEKRDRLLELLKPCEDKTYTFMKLYLENAKWKARCRGKNE